MTQKHTPTPWKTDGNEIWQEKPIIENKHFHICKVHGVCQTQVNKANASFIVRACNSHDELVEALKRTHKALIHHIQPMNRNEDYLASLQAEKAIAKAKAK